MALYKIIFDKYFGKEDFISCFDIKFLMKIFWMNNLDTNLDALITKSKKKFAFKTNNSI